MAAMRVGILMMNFVCEFSVSCDLVIFSVFSVILKYSLIMVRLSLITSRRRGQRA